MRPTHAPAGSPGARLLATAVALSLGGCAAGGPPPIEHGTLIEDVTLVSPERQEPLLGADPPQQLADTMHASWVRFAARGDCGWPKYDLGHRTTMRFDSTSAFLDDPRSAERALWEGVR